jgi:excinuclease UvrABC ATPase subunit
VSSDCHSTPGQASGRQAPDAACDACGGSRLNEISRHVRVKDKTIAQITKMSIGDAASYYLDLNLDGAKGEINDFPFFLSSKKTKQITSRQLSGLSKAFNNSSVLATGNSSVYCLAICCSW